ncbi:hypothetical protein AB0B21_34030 [Streptomyces rimosus]|uniref:hypothetical protein n=1 Tax=Streptomyces rimosus TaxID=1927 RepID=UPI00131B7D17|nr:hypothetical protein [Streptomyces rimosus]
MTHSDPEISNPQSNHLKGGLTEEALTAAIEKSGYPLQSAIYELLGSDFRVQQEWGFRDRITGDMRSCDLMAMKELDTPPSDASRIRTSLTVLIECKQSDLPYIFFSPARSPWQLALPQVTGLRGRTVRVWTDDSGATWTHSVLRALELDEEPFMTRDGFSIVSKCARKGPKLELSGTDAYNGIVMPLASAATHFITSSAPKDTYHWFDAYLLCGVAVLDAPMVEAKTTPTGTELHFTPWCRLFRHEPEDPGAFMEHTGQTMAIDVVHKDFFTEYLSGHLIPFARSFSERALRHHEVLATGKAFVPGMNANHNGLYDRLQPFDSEFPSNPKSRRQMPDEGNRVPRQ